MKNLEFKQANQDMIVEKWAPLLDADGGISNNEIRTATAMILESVQNETDGRSRMLTESIGAGGMGAAPAAGGMFGNYTPGSYGETDARIPTIVVPMLRRIFPQLTAHELVGVQPMTGPIGFAFALRAEYGRNGQFSNAAAPNKEIGYNNLDSRFAGLTATTDAPVSAGTAWETYYAGASNTSLDNGTTHFNGTGAPLTTAEGAKIGTDYPLAQFRLVKATAEAKERKLGGFYSLELAEDLMNTHGVNADTEMSNIITYEIKAGIDRNIVSEMVRSAIIQNGTAAGENSTVSYWSPVSADGRNQIERIGTLYTHLLERSQLIAQISRRGAGNFVIASPKVVALLQRFGMANDGKDGAIGGSGGIPKTDGEGIGSINKIGNLQTGHALFRDTFAGGNYMLIGFKGSNKYDSGVIYAPYIPVQLVRTIDPYDLNPKIGARCRDAIIGETGRPDGWEAGKYYQFVGIQDLSGTALVGDSASSRVFTY